jgi:hypothetical protein
MRRGKRNDHAEVVGESDGERGDGAALRDGEDHPAIEVSGELAIGFAQEDVLASGFREHGAHFGEGETGQQRDQPADEPYAKKEERPVNGGSDFARGKENPGTDDATHHQHHGVGERQTAEQGSLLCARRLLRWGGARHGLADAQVLRNLQRRAANAADDGGAVAAGERVVDFARASRTVQCGRRFFVTRCWRKLSHKFPRL